jgi:hypothetical protein|tara:strand:+ start:4826 stop:5614 length:789 start_codon:yes stop_codon:yes gene_type:complete
MSWVLSCLTFRELYDEVELVTDRKGKQLLVDKLKLPYTKVTVVLDRLNHYPKQLWAVGKLYAYQIQEKPFIHVDGDVFVWERFGKELEDAELIGQHLDLEEGHYHYSIQHLEKNKFNLPKEFKNDFDSRRRFDSSNAGIIGGNNIDFFKEYVDRAFHFIDTNVDKINKNVNGSSFAIIYEQYLFSVLARNKGIEIKHFITDKDENIKHISDFFNRFGAKKFVHLLSNAKSMMECYSELELQLLCDYPDYHKRISSFYDNKNI